MDVFTINPKCLSLAELYGEFDSNTMEWTDGLLSKAIRKFSKESSVKVTQSNVASASTDADRGDSRLSRTESRLSKASSMHDADVSGMSVHFCMKVAYAKDA